LQIMEVCGGHTHALFRYGIEAMLPPGLELVHGPGSPIPGPHTRLGGGRPQRRLRPDVTSPSRKRE
jgi:hypothetical protein